MWIPEIAKVEAQVTAFPYDFELGVDETPDADQPSNLKLKVSKLAALEILARVGDEYVLARASLKSNQHDKVLL
jgi:hypothetical protein